MCDKIKIGDIARDVCGDIGEVVDVGYKDNGEVWRYILAEYDESGRHTWPAHPDYTMKLN